MNPGELPIVKVGDPVNVGGWLFYKTEPMVEFNLAGGIFVEGPGADWLIAPWGKEESELWVFMRGNDGKSNPGWRSIRKVEPYLEPTSKSNQNDKIYAAVWNHLHLGVPL
jgi:hypothetical protein